MHSSRKRSHKKLKSRKMSRKKSSSDYTSSSRHRTPRKMKNKLTRESRKRSKGVSRKGSRCKRRSGKRRSRSSSRGKRSRSRSSGKRSSRSSSRSKRSRGKFQRGGFGDANSLSKAANKTIKEYDKLADLMKTSIDTISASFKSSGVTKGGIKHDGQADLNSMLQEMDKFKRYTIAIKKPIATFKSLLPKLEADKRKKDPECANIDKLVKGLETDAAVPEALAKKA
jgi:hypothetical protein